MPIQDNISASYMGAYTGVDIMLFNADTNMTTSTNSSSSSDSSDSVQ